MAAITLFVDPVCPFAWVSANWLLDTAGDEHTVALAQMSLAVLNDGQTVDAQHAPMIARSRRVGRLFAAAARRQFSFASLYRELGSRLHPHGAQTDDNAVAAALDAVGLDQGLAAALDDPGFDADVSAAHRISQQALGGRGGSPIISIDGHGYSGPVLTAPPPARQAHRLLNALIDAATTPGFAALHRPYQGPPSFTPSEDDR
ncbi:disulfide bond formation protein DsbA [Nocardia cyriacigeorgica]|uniref:Disulfide bond formation protein DsbA n=2 Tax=Nocardia cyriacigeorgica TaxID=135487 RepID=H6RA99_NOCCG|nr:hypothetical protein [Nocardia cyriacigeorgica]NEW32742.1 disulfide bond formation protein DsbA [Nocardia cyriacigeorgica]PPJ03608.1 disulfide bond formation protein DsbA [Nocardia cyriacigeorgica]BDT87348.1 hypothetical protein FMUAM8_31120 [Nocardia cyriacigeorgica]CCF63707.1 conserved protein of unknown function; putative Thioredoxin domain [Nocardia cyriacigeorgica GUH-2]